VSRFRPEVVAFNRRALKVYKRLGFVPVGRYSRAAPELGGQILEWITLEAAGEESAPVPKGE